MYNDYQNYGNGYMTPGYAAMQQQMQQMQMQQQNQNRLPPCQILTASGQQSIDTLRMSPNSSVLIAHETEPYIWKCVSDGLGNVTSQIFDISLHQEKPPVDTSVLEQRVAASEQRVAALEAIIIAMGENKNESTSRGKRQSNTKQPVSDDPAD